MADAVQAWAPQAWAAQAGAVVALYRRRWAIEQLFRTLKTQGFDIEGSDIEGSDIEGLRIEDPAPGDKLITAALIAAVAIQQLVHARDGGPGPLRPCTDVFQPEDNPLLEAYCAKLEGKTQRQKNPHPEGSLAYTAWVCARLGLGLRQTRRMHRILRKARTCRHAPRLARNPNRKTLPRHSRHQSRCVNPVAQGTGPG